MDSRMNCEMLSAFEVALIEKTLLNRRVDSFASVVYSIDSVMAAIKTMLIEGMEPKLHDLIPPAPNSNSKHRMADSSNPAEDPSQTTGGSVGEKKSRKQRPRQSDSYLDSEEGTLHTCVDCGYKTKRKDHYKRHLMTHSSEKPFKCDLCPFQTTDKWHLDRHMQTRAHSKRGTDSYPYSCDMCSYSSKNLARLERHQRTHTGERPFCCTHCDYKATQKSTLERHILTHTGEKPFKCEHCEYNTADAKSLKYHMLQKHHVESVQHQCDKCNYVTPVLRYYQLHMRTHSDVRPYLCDICGYSAKRPHALTKHYRCVHGEEKRERKPNDPPSSDESSDDDSQASLPHQPLPSISDSVQQGEAMPSHAQSITSQLQPLQGRQTQSSFPNSMLLPDVSSNQQGFPYGAAQQQHMGLLAGQGNQNRHHNPFHQLDLLASVMAPIFDRRPLQN